MGAMVACFQDEEERFGFFDLNGGFLTVIKYISILHQSSVALLVVPDFNSDRALEAHRLDLSKRGSYVDENEGCF